MMEPWLNLIFIRPMWQSWQWTALFFYLNVLHWSHHLFTMWPWLVDTGNVMCKLPGMNCICIIRNWPLSNSLIHAPSLAVDLWGVARDNLLTAEIHQWETGFRHGLRWTSSLSGRWEASCSSAAKQLHTVGWFRMLKSLSAHYKCNYLLYFGCFQSLFKLLWLNGSMKA